MEPPPKRSKVRGTFVEDGLIRSYVPQPECCVEEVGIDGKPKPRGAQCRYCHRFAVAYRDVNGKNTLSVYCHTESGIARLVENSHSFGQIFTEDTPEGKDICFPCVFSQITAKKVAGDSPPYTAEEYEHHMGHLVDGEAWCADDTIASILFYFLVYGYELTNKEAKCALITGRLAQGNLRVWWENPGSTLPEIEN